MVHLTGAVCALVGCVLMGPRHGRFDKSGRPVPMPGHSVPLSALGGLILVFGFFACNGTKQGSISNEGDGLAIAQAIVNTALGTSAAGLSTLIFNKTGIVPGTGGGYSFLVTMNGSLTGQDTQNFIIQLHLMQDAPISYSNRHFPFNSSSILLIMLLIT